MPAVEQSMGSEPTLEGFEPVYGRAEGQQPEAAVPHTMLAFIFALRSPDAGHVHLQATDFHSNTWHALKSLEQLEWLRDEVGLGGSWEDFLAYLRSAFASDNVKLILGGGSSNAVGGHGATTARIVAQKAKGSPKISLALTRLGGPSAKDVMGQIAVELSQAYRSLSQALADEKARANGLATALGAEKDKSEKLQQQIEATSFTGKKRKLGSGSQIASTSKQEDYKSPSVSQLQIETPLATPTSAEKAADEPAKPAPSRPKMRLVPPSSRRGKRKGTTIAADDDE